MEVDPIEELLGGQIGEGYGSDNDETVADHISSVNPTASWNKKRDDLANAMWADRNNA